MRLDSTKRLLRRPTGGTGVGLGTGAPSAGDETLDDEMVIDGSPMVSA